MVSISMYERCISSYPHVLFFAVLVLCRVFHISYAYAAGYIANTVANYGLKLFFRGMMGSAGNRPTPYHPENPFVIGGMNLAIGRADA